jgi:predicted lipoprotein with Yx(FWY)xxD motif
MPLQSASMKNALALLAACASLLVACGDDDSGSGHTDMPTGEERRVDTTTAAEAPAAAPAAAGRRGLLVQLRQSQFGPVLFDGRDRALYLFTRDPRRQSRCYGACAAAWPPFYAKGNRAPPAGSTRTSSAR